MAAGGRWGSRRVPPAGVGCCRRRGGRVGQAGLAGRSHPDRQVCVSDTRVPRRGARRGPSPKRCMTERCCVLFAPRFRAEQGGHRPRQEGLLVLRHHRVHGARGGEPAGTHAERGLVVLRRAHGNGPPAPPAPHPPRPAQRPAPPRRARPDTMRDSTRASELAASPLPSVPATPLPAPRPRCPGTRTGLREGPGRSRLCASRTRRLDVGMVRGAVVSH